MTYEELRTEYNKPVFKRFLRENLGEKCCNCGSDVGIQYHHIVPLAQGGTNKISNIVPVCARCHRAIHGNKHREYLKKSQNMGRPRLADDKKARETLADWITCKIGTKECIKRLGYKENTHLADLAITKEYKKENGIGAHRNNIDLIVKKGGSLEGRILGWAYIDGKYTEFSR